jgi:glycosyltransferase involved in cell wall biosynthesis
LLSDQPLRQRLINAGLRQAQRFTWERSAQELLAIYERVLAV